MTKNQTSIKNKNHAVGDPAKLLGASIGPALRVLVRRTANPRLWPILLREGIAPIVRLLLEANNTALINRWLDKGTKVVFVSSFPRSGNTWMRFMLADILLQMQSVETTTELPVHPDDLIAILECDSIVRRLSRCPDWAFQPPLTFVKTHFSFTRLEHMFSGHGSVRSRGLSSDSAPVRDCRALFLYRAPEDALVSYYHLEVCHRGNAVGGLDDFCRKGLSGWVENMTSYLRATENGFPIFFIPYEQLLEKPVIALNNFLQWLGVQHDSQIVERAVSNMRFCSLQAREKQENKTSHPVDENTLFFRRGRTGAGRSELQESTLREIHERTASLLNEANRRYMMQFSEPLAPATPVPILSGAGASVRNGEATEPGISSRPQRM
jgi:hypothetical protein